MVDVNSLVGGIEAAEYDGFEVSAGRPGGRPGRCRKKRSNKTEAAMGSKKRAEVDQIKNFDSLPNDSLVSIAVAAAILGVSTRTVIRNPPVLQVQISERRVGFRVGDLRDKVRGRS